MTRREMKDRILLLECRLKALEAVVDMVTAMRRESELEGPWIGFDGKNWTWNIPDDNGHRLDALNYMTD